MLCAGCLCRCQGCCHVVWAGCRQAAAATDLSSTLSPGPPLPRLFPGWCAVGVGGFSQAFFPVPLADQQCPPARAQLHEPAALMLLCSWGGSPWRCLHWLCSGPQAGAGSPPGHAAHEDAPGLLQRAWGQTRAVLELGCAPQPPNGGADGEFTPFLVKLCNYQSLPLINKSWEQLILGAHSQTPLLAVL